MTYFILRSNVGSYWLIIPKYDVHTAGGLQNIRQNHWTMKYRSCWPSLHDPQVHVTRFSHVSSTICISCFHNWKSRKNTFKGVLDFDLEPHPRTWSLGSGVMEWKPTLQGTYGPNSNAFWWAVGELYPTWEPFNIKLWSNSTNGTEWRTNEQTNEHTNRKTKTIYHSAEMP